MQSGRYPQQFGLNPLHGGDAGGHRAVDLSGRSVRQAEPEAAEVDQRRTLVVIAGRAGGLEAGPILRSPALLRAVAVSPAVPVTVLAWAVQRSRTERRACMRAKRDRLNRFPICVP